METMNEESRLLEHRRNFLKIIQEECVKKNSVLIMNEDYQRICRYLEDKETNATTALPRKYRKRIKRNNFRLVTLSENGPKALCSTSNESQNLLLSNVISNVILPCEEIFTAIKDLHYVTLHYVTKHVGYHNTFEKVSSRYSNISRNLVEEFVKLCPTCSENKNQVTHAPLQPIISSGFWQRMQIDLVDMTSVPDGHNTKIGHCVDHFSKYHVLFPLKSKSAVEVAHNLKHRVFSYFGLPLLLHSDHGKEFVNSLINEVVHSWPGECNIIHGSPRHPWVQGCVERYNGCIQEMIRKKSSETGSCEWASWLPEIQFALNCLTCRTTKNSPSKLSLVKRPTFCRLFHCQRGQTVSATKRTLQQELLKI